MTDEPSAAVSLQPNKGGRPRKLTADEATINQITGMAAIFCTKSEVCAVLRVSRPTLDRFFADNPEVLAAEQRNILCRGMELDPAYVDVSVRRWETFTDRTATLEATGQTFQEVQDERRRQAAA